MNLLPHNEEAYNKVMSWFKDHDKAAIVHATGTGKSYIIAAVANHFNKVIVIAPNIFVLNETKKVCKDGVIFCTYTAMMNNQKPSTCYDLIVLDEFHRAGAEKWGEGVKRLIEANPNAKLFGTTATHVRYLDNERNMADELFDGNVVSHLPLKDALEKNILPTPTYVASLYEFDSEYNRCKDMLKKSNKDISEPMRKLNCIASNWDESHGVPVIIRKYISKDVKRIIVFCSRIAKAKEARVFIWRWFVSAGFFNIRFYNINSMNNRAENDMDNFENDDFDGLKIAISVNMLNEGIHVPHVDGIMMLRSTISPIIIEQQIGRCLTVNNFGKTPVVIDLVNNLELIDSHVYGSSMKSNFEVKRERSKTEIEKLPFNVIDECRDIREALYKIKKEYGSPISYTFDECVSMASQYHTLMEFLVQNRPLYDYIFKRGWLKEIKDICNIQSTRRKWTKEKCIAEANKYTYLKDFEKGSHGAYVAAYTYGWYNEIKAHFALKRHANWTKDECMVEAKKYNSHFDFQRGCSSAYVSAYRNGWLEEIGKHFIRINHSKWTKEECAAEAKKYTNSTSFKKGSGGAYSASYNNGWYSDITQHFKTKGKKGRRKWTKEKCAIEARKYSTLTSFSHNSRGAYNAAKRYHWLEEISTHFSHKIHKWTKEECAAEANKYQNSASFMRGNRNAYTAAMQHGWYAEITQHFIPQRRFAKKKKSNETADSTIQAGRCDNQQGNPISMPNNQGQ